jgi:hypothetical protein
MSFHLKSDAQDRLFASRDAGQRSARRATRADEANPLEGKPERPRASRPTFVEDFMLEHSLPSLQVTSNRMAGTF